MLYSYYGISTKIYRNHNLFYDNGRRMCCYNKRGTVSNLHSLGQWKFWGSWSFCRSPSIKWWKSKYKSESYLWHQIEDGVWNTKDLNNVWVMLTEIYNLVKKSPLRESKIRGIRKKIKNKNKEISILPNSLDNLRWDMRLSIQTLYKKLSFIKGFFSTVSCGVGHTYWRNP